MLLAGCNRKAGTLLRLLQLLWEGLHTLRFGKVVILGLYTDYKVTGYGLEIKDCTRVYRV